MKDLLVIATCLVLALTGICGATENPYGNLPDNRVHADMSFSYGTGHISHPPGSLNRNIDAVRVALNLRKYGRLKFVTLRLTTLPAAGGCTDMGVLLGQRLNLGSHAWMSCSVGLGLASGKWEETKSYFTGRYFDFFGILIPEYATRRTISTFQVVSFPFEMELMFSPLTRCGAGVSLFGNQNSRNSFWGWGLNFGYFF